MNPYTLIKYVPLPVLRAVALFVAKTVNHLPNDSTSIQRSIDINLRLAYPEMTVDQRRMMSNQVIYNQLQGIAESAKSWSMPPNWSVEKIRTVHNATVLYEALDDPNGMMVLVPHLGTWEMMNPWFNQFGSSTIMYKPIKNKLFNDFVLQGRQRLKSTLVPTDASGVKAIFKALKRSEFSIILPDHVPPPKSGVIAPFFGIETLTSTLAPKLASKTNCSIVGLVCIRNQKPTLWNLLKKDKGFDIYCFKLDEKDLYSKDLQVATTAMNRGVETMVRAHTEHYMWGYHRFKKMPGLLNPYKASKEKLQEFIDSYVKLNQ